MGFDLEKHLQNHAMFFKKYSKFQEDNLHFTFSYLDLQFIDRDISTIMSNLLRDLREATSYKVANGKREDKHGNTIQKFTNRKVDLSKDLIAEAIHIQGPEGEDTMPHIHFIIDEKARLGRRYSLLKKHIIEISNRYDLVPHFDEMVEHNPMAIINLAKSTKILTWSWKKMTNKELKKDLNKRGVENAIKILSDYTLKTNNLSYYIKSMEGLKKRLNRMKLSIYYKEHNLKDTYPIPLTVDDMKVIELIKKRKFSQKDIKPYIKSPILRDFIRYSSDITTPYIINAIKEQTNLLNGVYKNKEAVKNYLKITQKMPKNTKSTNMVKKIKDNSEIKYLNNTLQKIAKSSTSQINFEKNMNEIGYFKFKLKKRKGETIGCTYIKNGEKINFEFIDMGLNWSKLKEIFQENRKKVKDGIKLEPLSDIDFYDNNHNINNQKIVKKIDQPKTIKLDYKSDSIREKKYINKIKSKIRRVTNARQEAIIREFKRGIQFLKNATESNKRKIEKIRESIGRLRERRLFNSRSIGPIRERHTNLGNAISRYLGKINKYKNLTERVDKLRGGVEILRERARDIKEPIVKNVEKIFKLSP